MEEDRRKIRIFLICIVMTAVLVGIIYYVTDVYSSKGISEGTLVQNEEKLYAERNYQWGK